MFSSLPTLVNLGRRKPAVKGRGGPRSRHLLLEPLEARIPLAALVQLKASTADLSGAPLTSVAPGAEFLLKVTATDLRASPRGVFAAWVDLLYDPSRAVLAGPIEYDPRSINQRTGDTRTLGLLDEVGAFDGLFSSAPAEKLLFQVRFKALTAGSTDFTLNRADQLPDHDTLLFGMDAAVAISDIAYVSTRLKIQNSPRQLSMTPLSTDEGQTAVLNGNFVDDQVAASHSLTVSWGDWNNTAGSTFDLPSTRDLSVGQTLLSTTDDSVLTLTTVDRMAGAVTFKASHVFVNDGLIGVGGVPSDNAVVSASLTSNFRDGTWAPPASLPAAGAYAASASLGGQLYLIGGHSQEGGVSNAVVAFDPATQTTSAKAPLPTARSGAAAAVIQGKLYVVGGWTDIASTQSTNTLEIYDPDTNGWSSGAAALISRSDAAAAVIDNRLYVVNGLAGAGGNQGLTLEVYDPATNSWSTGAPAPTPRTGAGAAVIGGKLYVVGGFSYNPATSTVGTATDAVEVYDPATDSWTGAAMMPTARGATVVAALGHELYVAGGQTAGNVLVSTVEVFDPAMNTWAPAPSMPMPLGGAAGGVINDRLFVAGGVHVASELTNSVHVFVPSAQSAPLIGQTQAVVRNAAPVVTSAGSNGGPIGLVTPGQLVTLNASFIDAGIFDYHTAQVDWGDGRIDAVVIEDGPGQGTVTASHAYVTGGHYTATVTVIDQDRGVTTKAIDVHVTGASVNNRTLYVIGTAGNDTVSVTKQGKSLVAVTANFTPASTPPGAPGPPTFPLAGIDRIVVMTGDGDDTVAVSTKLTRQTLLIGGAGRDSLSGGGGANVLVGGDGDDFLKGGSKRDLLIGGLGADNLQGQGGDDILIAGATVHDATTQALLAIVSEWQRTDLPAAKRSVNLRNGGGRNGAVVLNSGAIAPDGVRDTLTDSSGVNWFWAVEQQDELFKKRKTDLLN